MKRKHILISVVSILVLITTLGCGLFGKPDPTAVPTKPPAPTKAPEPTRAPKPTEEPEPTEKPEPTEASGADVELGEEIRSEDGGYSFNTIPGYTIEESFGMTGVEAPDADPDLGPALMLMGSISEESATPEELYDGFTSDLEAGIEVTDPREIDVDGKPGMVADVSGSDADVEMVGRIVVVAVTPTHHFVMLGAAPADRWGEFGPLFDAVLASVRFFSPAGAEEPPMGEGTRQWAVSATASSQYGDTGWAADQATGAPDAPDCGDYTTAWASVGYDTVEWIELEYDGPVLPTEVNIYQNYNPNQVVQVELLDVWGEYHTIYTGTPQDESDDCPFVLHIPVEGADYQALAVKITVDQSVLGDWVEIDAVELVGIADRPGFDEPEEPPASGDVPAGSFRFEVIGAGEDAVIDGGIIQDNSSYSEYGVAFVEEGSLARYSMTIYLPHDVAPGEMALKPYLRSDTSHAPSAAVFIGAWFYFATEGTVTIDEVADGTVSGSFQFKAVREDDVTIEVEVVGTFNQVPLGK